MRYKRKYCKNCSDWECRCSDCVSVIESDDGRWYCDEQQDYCENIKTCYEFNDDTGCEY